MKFFTGKKADFALGTTTPVIYCGKGWSIDPTAAEHRTDNTCDNGFSSRITGILDCTFSISQDWDADNNPMDDPPGLYAGAVLADVNLILDSAATTPPKWFFTEAVVLGTPMTNMVDALCHVDFNCANNGPFTRPTGSFTPSEADSLA